MSRRPLQSKVQVVLVRVVDPAEPERPLLIQADVDLRQVISTGEPSRQDKDELGGAAVGARALVDLALAVHLMGSHDFF